MSDDDLQKALQTLAPMLDDVVAEPVGEDFAGQGRDGDAGGLALEDVAEVLKVRVPATDDGGAQLEGRDVGPGVNLVRGIHGPRRRAVCLRVLDLRRDGERGNWQGRGVSCGQEGEAVRQGGRDTYFNL